MKTGKGNKSKSKGNNKERARDKAATLERKNKRNNKYMFCYQ